MRRPVSVREYVEENRVADRLLVEARDSIAPTVGRDFLRALQYEDPETGGLVRIEIYIQKDSRQ